MIGTYTYDAWGVCTYSFSGSQTTLESSIVLNYNPFRYRGYFYDRETKLYYLQTRYYNPSWCRFISIDNPDVLVFTPDQLTDKNFYAYCDNNPIMRTDHGGQFWDTVFDVVSLVASVVEVCVNPTDPWAWAGLAGDAVDLIPFVTGVGETTRLVKTGVKVADVVDDGIDVAKAVDKAYDATKAIDNAADSIDTYKDLRKVSKGSGLEVHHIVEKRFANSIGIQNTDDMLSIALDKQTHRKFTKAWRDEFKYGINYSALGKNDVWNAAQRVYANYPSLLEAARKTIFG